MKYFCSESPSVQLSCSGGHTIKWRHPAGIDEGMIAVDEEDPENKSLLDCLALCIRTKRGGVIREVTALEFEEWEKKTQGLKTRTPKREEFSGGSSMANTSNFRRVPSADEPVVEVESPESPTTLRKPLPPQKSPTPIPDVAPTNIPTRKNRLI